MTEDMPTYKRWRKDWERWTREAEAVEAIAAQHPDIPFEVETISNTLTWNEFDEDIQTFSIRVRKVAAIFGAPTTVRVVSETGTETTAPDMEALWSDDPKIALRAFWPQCRIHPESEYIPAVRTKGEYPEIHPECADVLKELEDYEPETASLVGANR